MPSGFKYLAEGHVDLAALVVVHLPVPVGAYPLVAGGAIWRGPVKAGDVGSPGVEEGFDYIGVSIGDVKRKAPFLGILVEAVAQSLGIAVSELDCANSRLAAFVRRVDGFVVGESSHF